MRSPRRMRSTSSQAAVSLLSLISGTVSQSSRRMYRWAARCPAGCVEALCGCRWRRCAVFKGHPPRGLQTLHRGKVDAAISPPRKIPRFRGKSKFDQQDSLGDVGETAQRTTGIAQEISSSRGIAKGARRKRGEKDKQRTHFRLSLAERGRGEGEYGTMLASLSSGSPVPGWKGSA
jgi:hypothetical protein